MERPSVDDYFGDWKAREALAQEMLPIMGKLENEKGVQIYPLWPISEQPLGGQYHEVSPSRARSGS